MKNVELGLSTSNLMNPFLCLCHFPSLCLISFWRHSYSNIVPLVWSEDNILKRHYSTTTGQNESDKRRYIMVIITISTKDN